MSLSESFEDLDPKIAGPLRRVTDALREEIRAQVDNVRNEIGRLSAAGPASAPSTPPESEDSLDPLSELKHAVAGIDGSSSQAAILTALLEGVGRFSSRAAFMLIRDDGMRCWGSLGFDDAGRPMQGEMVDAPDGSVWTHIADGAGSRALSAEECAQLCDQFEAGAPEVGVLLPMSLGDRVAACLYADRLADGALNMTALQLLTLVAGQTLETLPMRQRGYTPTLRVAPTEPAQALAPPVTPAVSPAEPVAEPAAAEPEPTPIDAEPAAEAEAPAEALETPPIAPIGMADLDTGAAPVEAVPPPTPPIEEEAPPIEVETPPIEPATSPVEVEPPLVEPETPPVEVEPPLVEPETPPVEVEPPPVEVAAPPVEVAAPPVEAQPPFEPPSAEPPAEAPPVESAAPPVVSAKPSADRSSTQVVPPDDVLGPGWAFTTKEVATDAGNEALQEEARRLARLLVTEIKLYNEEQVEQGRRSGDIYRRLREDIDRSRQIFDDRIDDKIRSESDYFKDALVRILAGGDESLLGM